MFCCTNNLTFNHLFILQSDLLLGILDILDPELFLKTELPEAQEPQPELVLDGGAGEQVPASPSAALGPAPVKLEALNELIHFDHIYTKPAEVVNEESISDVKSDDSVTFSEIDEEIEVENQAVSVKDEPEEVVILAVDRTPDTIEDFFSDASSFGGYEKASNLMDVYSDSGYERSPSPFSNISSPLCSEGSWDDMFATELFPQLISV